MGFSRQVYWGRLPCPSPGDLPNPGIEPASLMSSTLAGGFFTTSPTWEAQLTVLFHKIDTISKKYLTGNAYQSHLWNFFKCICSSSNYILLGQGAGTDGIEDICTFEISRSDTHFPVGNQHAKRGQESWRTQDEPGFLS